MKLVWCTDIHLNFVPNGACAFGVEVASRNPDLVVISGDIAESASFEGALKEFARGVGCPVYFVLGNHDYYGSSIKHVNAKAKILGKPLHWLTKMGIVELSPTVALVGHEGWYDCRIGDYTKLEMSDFTYVKDLRGLPKLGIVAKCRDLGRESAEAARPFVEEALSKYKKVFFVTHVPPFHEAAVYKGKPSDPVWAPWFTNLSMGDMLFRAAENSTNHLTVLCGHTHGDGIVEMLPNLKVYTGGAEYYSPSVCGTFTI